MGIFSENDPFTKELREKIDNYFLMNNKSIHANHFFYLKAFIILNLFVLSYAGIYLIPGIGFLWFLNWILLGFLTLLICLNIIHDAFHYTISKNRSINNIFGALIKLVGLNDYLWKNSHNQKHHIYTNIEGMDPDLADISIFRFSARQKWRSIHKYQHIYAFFLYSIHSLVWIFKTDFQSMSRCKKAGRNTWIDFIVYKCIYIILFLVLPSIFWNGNFLLVFLGFVSLHLAFGLSSAFLFLVSHLSENVPTFDKQQNYNVPWTIHQLRTTVTHSRNSLLFKWLGCINYQIEHHLFPRVCHVHYPNISSIITETAMEHSLSYLEIANFRKAIISHINLLNNLGKKDITDGSIKL